MSYRGGGGNRNRSLPPKINYKRPDLLKDYVDEQYKIYPRRRTKLRASAQRRLRQEIKRARALALLPFTDRHAQ